MTNDPKAVPSLKNLAIILRDPSLWPEGFEWDYFLSNKCAIGLIWQLGWCGPGEQPMKGALKATEVLGIGVEERNRIFFDCAAGSRFPSAVQVADLVDQIDEEKRGKVPWTGL